MNNSINQRYILPIKLGRLFYRYRGIIATPFFILLLFLHRAQPTSPLPHLLIIIGLALRIWTSGYIGIISRSQEIAGEYKIVNGPYFFFRHPLYLGNFFLVLGTILLFNPPCGLKILLVLIFLFEYATIILAEEDYLKGLPPVKVRFSWKKSRTELSTIIVLGIIYLIYFILR
ncbi:MAG: methyltransferase [candidate division WOR-3 bacterium]